MAFKREKPIIQGTAAHKEALKLNKTMDNSSMPDGRPKSSAFQKNEGDSKKAKMLKGTTVFGKTIPEIKKIAGEYKDAIKTGLKTGSDMGKAIKKKSSALKLKDRSSGRKVKGTKNRLPKLIKAKKTKKEDSPELAAFKQEQIDKRKARKQAVKDAKKSTKKTRKRKDRNWKVKIGNVTIGNASNPELQKKKPPTAAEKKAKQAEIEERSKRMRKYKVVS